MKVKNAESDFGPAADLVKQFEDDGGPNWAPQDKQHDMFHENIKNCGPGWEKAKDASRHAFGRVEWPFVMWWKKKYGG